MSTSSPANTVSVDHSPVSGGSSESTITEVVRPTGIIRYKFPAPPFPSITVAKKRKDGRRRREEEEEEEGMCSLPGNEEKVLEGLQVGTVLSRGRARTLHHPPQGLWR